MYICLDTCGGQAFTGTSLKAIEYTDDQHCDDGGDGSEFSTCLHGTDCTDCGPRVATGVYECQAVAASSPPPPYPTFEIFVEVDVLVSAGTSAPAIATSLQSYLADNLEGEQWVTAETTTGPAGRRLQASINAHVYTTPTTCNLRGATWH